MTESTHQAVQPVKPVAPYLGGKFKLSKQIISIINQVPHTCYAEPFVGMGGIFLRRNYQALFTKNYRWCF